MGHVQRRKSGDPLLLDNGNIMMKAGTETMTGRQPGWTGSLPGVPEKAGAESGQEGSRFLFLSTRQACLVETRMVRDCLKAAGISLHAPVDWCCIRNFQEKNRPRILALPAGKGPAFRSDMKRFIDEANRRLRQSLSAQRLREKTAKVERHYEEQTRAAVSSWRQPLKNHDLSFLVSSRIPVIPGQRGGDRTGLASSSPDANIDSRLNNGAGVLDQLPVGFQPARECVREIKKKCSEDLESCVQQSARRAIAPLMARLRKKYRGFPRILVYLEDVEEDILANLSAFTLPTCSNVPFSPRSTSCHSTREQIFSPYSVAVLADRSANTDPPVIFVRTSDHEELMGCFTADESGGAQGSDAAPLRGGLLHEADGGCLVVEASWILRNIHLWEEVKKTMKEHELAITASASRTGIFAAGNTVSEAVPLHLAVMILGSPAEHSILSFVDPEFIGLVGDPWYHEDLSDTEAHNTFPGRASEGETFASCHPSARKAILQLCTTRGIADDHREGHLESLVKAIGKARSYAGPGDVTAEHVSLALKDAYPEFSPGMDTGIPRKHTFHTGTNRYTVEPEIMTETTISLSGKVLTYGK